MEDEKDPFKQEGNLSKLPFMSGYCTTPANLIRPLLTSDWDIPEEILEMIRQKKVEGSSKDSVRISDLPLMSGQCRTAPNIVRPENPPSALLPSAEDWKRIRSENSDKS